MTVQVAPGQSAQMKRGSVTDIVTLTSYPFYYDPSVRSIDKTSYAARKVIGNRLENRLWIGDGSGDVYLDVYLLDNKTMQTQLANFRSLILPQIDTGAPHPVYINIGAMYVGRWFVMEEVEFTPISFSYNINTAPYEGRLILKLCEIPITTATNS